MRRIAIAFVILLFFPLTRLNALTWHVPSQYPTIWEAMSVAGSGDTVLVADGTYYATPPGAGLYHLFNNKQNVTLISEYGKDNTILMPASDSDWMINFYMSSNCTISGFTLSNSNRFAIGTYQSSGIKILNCNIIASSREGINIDLDSGNIDIAHNMIIENSTGIKTSGHNVIISNNTISRNNLYGIDCNPGSGTTNIISNHVSENNQGGILFGTGYNASVIVQSNIIERNANRGLESGSLNSNLVYICNNTIAANDYGMKLYNGSPEIRGNIIANNIGPGIIAVEYSNPYILCNDVWGNSNYANGNYVGYITDQTGYNGNISTDPFFCNASVRDYSVAANSPALLANCGAMGAITTPGCSNQTPIEQITWGAIKALYR